MTATLSNPLDLYLDLQEFDLYVGDGHWHAAAAHDEPIDGAKRAVAQGAKVLLGGLRIGVVWFHPGCRAQQTLGKPHRKRHGAYQSSHLDASDLPFGGI